MYGSLISFPVPFWNLLLLAISPKRSLEYKGIPFRLHYQYPSGNILLAAVTSIRPSEYKWKTIRFHFQYLSGNIFLSANLNVGNLGPISFKTMVPYPLKKFIFLEISFIRHFALWFHLLPANVSIVFERESDKWMKLKTHTNWGGICLFAKISANPQTW